MTDYLKSRGFAPETVERVGWRVEQIGDRCKRYGLPRAAADAVAWFIPYRVNGRVSFERIRLIGDTVERFGGGKYRQPAGASLRLYDPFGWLDRDEPFDGLLIVEGEANAVAIAQALPGLPVVGLPGHNALTPEAAQAVAHVPVIWLWLDLYEKGAQRAQRAAIRALMAAGVTDVRPIEGVPEGEDANDLVRRLDRPAKVIGGFLDAARTSTLDAKPRRERGSGPRLKDLDIADMHRSDPPPVDWVAEGLAVRGSLAMLAGQPGEGKSLLAMAAAAGVAHGESVAGMRCNRGRVLIFDAEQSEAEIHRRVRALELPADAVAIVRVDGVDLARDLPLILDRIEAVEPDFVVLDSYRSLWSGDENDPARVAPTLYDLNAAAEDAAAAIMLLHHAGKGDTPYRGSTAIAGAVELGFTLGRAKDDPDPQRRKLECWKCRPAQEPPTRWLRIADDRARGWLIVEEADAFDGRGRGRPPRTASELQDHIRALLTDGELRQGDIARALGRSPYDGTVRRVLEALEYAGSVRRRQEGKRNVWSLIGPAKETCQPLPNGNGRQVWQDDFGATPSLWDDAA